MRKNINAACAVFCAAVILLLSGCGSKIPNQVYSAKDIEGKTVGFLLNTASEGYLSGLGDIISKRGYNSTGEIAEALAAGSIDCIVADEDASEKIADTSGLKMLDEYFINRDYCIAVSEDNKTLFKTVNSTLKAMRADGTLSSIAAGREFEMSESDDTTDTLLVAVNSGFYPYCYYDEDGTLQGIEIDLVVSLCRRMGVQAEFYDVERDKLVYMAESGKVSFSIGRITAGDAAVSYSDSYLTSVQRIVVRKD